MSIKTIVLDFGNVVAWFSHLRAAEQLAVYGEASPEDLVAFLFNGELEEDYESGRISSDAFIKHICRSFQLTCTPEQFALAYSDMFSPNEAVCALLPRLKGRYRLALLSNTTDLHSQHFLAQFAQHVKWFDHIVLSHKVGERKPRPGIYEHCRKLVSCRAEECLLIDDLAANIAGAKACGWQGLVYNRGHDLAANLAKLGVALTTDN